MKEKKIKGKFTEEFKDEAIELSKRVGTNQAARDLGINEGSIRYWKKKTKPTKSDFTKIGVQKSYEELVKENRQLEKENGYLKEINKVLKKSTAIFSADHLGGLK